MFPFCDLMLIFFSCRPRLRNANERQFQLERTHEQRISFITRSRARTNPATQPLVDERR
jgi:TnpA family transposase